MRPLLNIVRASTSQCRREDYESQRVSGVFHAARLVGAVPVTAVTSVHLAVIFTILLFTEPFSFSALQARGGIALPGSLGGTWGRTSSFGQWVVIQGDVCVSLLCRSISFLFLDSPEPCSS